MNLKNQKNSNFLHTNFYKFLDIFLPRKVLNEASKTSFLSSETKFLVRIYYDEGYSLEN